MPETVIPAPSPEAVRAAVQNGADAVYIPAGSFGDRAFAEAVKYCRIRGAKVYFSLPDTQRDSEDEAMLKKARRAAEAGAAAIETGDPGMLCALHRMLPDTPIHYRGGIMNAAGAATAAYLGAARVTLSPDLSLEEIQALCKASRIELELPCHGPVCSGAGRCRLSAFRGSGCAAFGDCSASCRRAFGTDSRRSGFYLSRRDICLANKVGPLSEAGVSALRVLGTGRRPEYSALTARVYSAAAAGRAPDPADLHLLEDAFAPAGMTEGFLFGGGELFGHQDDRPHYPQTVLGDVREAYIHEEAGLIPIRLAGTIYRGEPTRLIVTDGDGHRVIAEGPVPSEAFGKEETGSAQLRTALYNLTGTPFRCTEALADAGRGLYVPTAELIALRKKALAQLAQQRAEFPRPRVEVLPGVNPGTPALIPPDINIYVRRADQLSPQLAGLKPEMLYIPMTELLRSPAAITPFWENGRTAICAVLPAMLHDGEDSQLIARLDELKELQVRDVLVNEIGQIFPAAARGFTVRAGMGLAVYNSRSVLALRELRIASVTAAPELKFSEIKALSKALPTEAVIYGRTALLQSEADIAAAAGADALRAGRDILPILPEYNGRSLLYSADKLFLGAKKKDLDGSGLWCGRLDFTTESAEECVLVTQRFLGQNKHNPAGTTKGLYY